MSWRFAATVKVVSFWSSPIYAAMIVGENRQLVTDEPVEFEEQPIEVHQDCMRITDRF
jgi:hypothetical protein